MEYWTVMWITVLSGWKRRCTASKKADTAEPLPSPAPP